MPRLRQLTHETRLRFVADRLVMLRNTREVLPRKVADILLKLILHSQNLVLDPLFEVLLLDIPDLVLLEQILLNCVLLLPALLLQGVVLRD